VSRLIDLSIPLDNEIPADPPFQPVEIDYVAHDQGAAELAGCERGANKTTTFPFENGTREIVPAGTFPEVLKTVSQPVSRGRSK